MNRQILTDEQFCYFDSFGNGSNIPSVYFENYLKDENLKFKVMW